ncbi:hypothetical protein Hanom_Chr16g01458401 [Helianthus anomalus]
MDMLNCSWVIRSSVHYFLYNDIRKHYIHCNGPLFVGEISAKPTRKNVNGLRL